MEIDISIRGVSPVELQRLFMGMQLSDAVLGKIPDRKGMIQNFSKNGIWSPEERDTIRDCTNEKDAISKYRERFPNSKRTSDGVRRMFTRLQGEKTAQKPIDFGPGTASGDTPLIPAGAPVNGLRVETPPVKKGAKTVPDKKLGKTKVNKYGIPLSLFYTDKKLYQRLWNRCTVKSIRYEEALKPEKSEPENKSNPVKKKPSTRGNTRPDAWSPEETGAIKDCSDQHAAVKRYKKKFPDSKRKPWAVEQRWYILTKEKRPARTSRSKQPAADANKTPDSPSSGSEKVFFKDGNGKTHLLKGVKIPETKKIENPSGGDTGSLDGGHKDAPDIKKELEKQPAIEGADKITLPASRPASRGDFPKGTRVKQIGGPRLCAGIGVIERSPINQPEVLVRFDNGMEWLKREYLQVVAEGTV